MPMKETMSSRERVIKTLNHEVPDRVPIYDVLTIAALAKERGARFIGPNTLGVLSPDKAVLGMIGGRAASAREWFFPGPVGITSRSGGITSSMAYYLAQQGIGATSLVHVGGDAVVGLPHPEVVKLYEGDPETKAVVMFGEIGTTQEERVADLIQEGNFTKPLIAYVGGKAAKSGTRFSHAGAIVEGTRGSHESKVQRLKEVGVHVVGVYFPMAFFVLYASFLQRHIRNQHDRPDGYFVLIGH